MEFVEALRALEQAGTEQNRKVYKRHGAREPLFGVSFAELGRLQKLIKVDHSLARQLWQTDNHDARVLALQIADPARLDLATAESWLHGVHDYTVSYSEAKTYCNQLAAPVKGFYSFEHSAHSPLFEEPERMREIIEQDVFHGKSAHADA